MLFRSSLWELAGYDDKQSIGSEESFSHQPAVMILPLDARIVYSDAYRVTINQYGVVMNFMQNAGQNGQPLSVARIGMSIDHAKRVVEILQETIKTASKFPQAKNLPAPKSDKDKNK